MKIGVKRKMDADIRTFQTNRQAGINAEENENIGKFREYFLVLHCRD
jgi:hypothetical protein